MVERERILWVLVSTALILLTLPGVAFLYGGMVRKKNVLNTLVLPLIAQAMVSLEWLCLGQARWFTRVLGAPELGCPFHAITAALALALLSGALVERVRVSFFLLFGALWAVLVYGALVHWLWGSGWLVKLGSLDYAGGAVIHIGAGVSALVAAIIVGHRKGYGQEDMKPHHLPYSLLGVGLMWVGWFGFSAGQALASMAAATVAFVATQVSASSAALTWMMAEWLQRDKPTVLGMASGVVAGLVAIAPAAGYVSPLAAVVIGVGAGGFCYMVVNYVKIIAGYDDALDVFGIHGVGGTWGMVATGLFASTAVNPDGSDGLFYGYAYQLLAQAVAVVAAWIVAGGGTALLLKGIALVLEPRVSREAEEMGLDLAQHGERGYS
jgi:Amt family ammonium transporter